MNSKIFSSLDKSKHVNHLISSSVDSDNYSRLYSLSIELFRISLTSRLICTNMVYTNELILHSSGYLLYYDGTKITWDR